MTAAPRQRALWERLLPGVVVLRRYERVWLRGDVLAGVTVAAYLVPQVMAYAEVAGLPRGRRALGGVGALLVYAVLGLVASALGRAGVDHGADDGRGRRALGPPAARRTPSAAAALAVAVGRLCLARLGRRLGFLADLLSRPVLVGYMAGIAVADGRQPARQGHRDRPSRGLVPAELRSSVTHSAQCTGPTRCSPPVVLACSCSLQRFPPRCPGRSSRCCWRRPRRRGLRLVDRRRPRSSVRCRTGCRHRRCPTSPTSTCGLLLPAALGVAVVGYSDNVLTGRAFAARHREAIDSDQEFLALGAANVAAGLAARLPGQQSGSRTVHRRRMGGRTQLYSLVVARPRRRDPALRSAPSSRPSRPPRSAPSSSTPPSGSSTSPSCGGSRAFRRSELVLALATTAAVLLFGVLPGIGSAIALSVLDLLRRIVHPHDGVLGYVRASPACTTSTTTPMPSRCPASSSTATTRRSSSPTPTTSPSARWRPSTRRRRASASSGSCSTPRRTTEVDLTAVDALE